MFWIVVCITGSEFLEEIQFTSQEGRYVGKVKIKSRSSVLNTLNY